MKKILFLILLFTSIIYGQVHRADRWTLISASTIESIYRVKISEYLLEVIAASGTVEFKLTNSERSFRILNNPADDILTFNYNAENRFQFSLTDAWFPLGKLGIGTTGPDLAVEINSSDGNNLRLTYNDANGTASYYADFLTDAGGDLTINASGDTTTIADVVIVDKIGVGTSKPEELLHVQSAINVGMLLKNTGDGVVEINAEANRASSNTNLLELKGIWDGTTIARLAVRTGDDTGNKDDGYMIFSVSEGGSLDEAMRIKQDGGIRIINTLYLGEQASAGADVAGDGQFWVKDDAPNTPYFTDDTGVERIISTSDYAGLACNDVGATTIDYTDVWEKFILFATDAPEKISDAANGTDDITVGASADYSIHFHGSANVASATKEFELSVFEIHAASIGGGIASNTEANPIVITTNSAHSLTGGELVKLSGLNNATELNDHIYLVKAGASGSTLSLTDFSPTDINSTGYGVANTGTIQLVTETSIHTHKEYGMTTIGSWSASFLATLVKDDLIELYMLNVTDASNITMESAQLWIERK